VAIIVAAVALMVAAVAGLVYHCCTQTRGNYHVPQGLTARGGTTTINAVYTQGCQSSNARGDTSRASVLVRASSVRGGYIDISGYAAHPEGDRDTFRDAALYSVPLDTAGYDGYACF